MVSTNLSYQLRSLYCKRRSLQSYSWRTHDQHEMDWLEVEGEKLAAYEFKWQDSKIKFPKAFTDACPDAERHWVNRENYIDFITIKI